LTKDEIFFKFSEIGGNYKNQAEAKLLSKDINSYIQNSKEIDVHILAVRTLLELFEEEFNLVNFSDFERACKISFLVVERLLNLPISQWDLYDITIAQFALTWTTEFEKSKELANNTLFALEKHIDNKGYSKVKLAVRFNLSARLLKADFMEIDAGEELERSLRLDEDFNNNMNAAMPICENNLEEFEKYKVALQIRSALFDREYNLVDDYLVKLKMISDKDFYKVILDSVKPYFVYADTSITEKQLRTIVGSKLRELRNKNNITAEEIGKILGYKIAHITAVERGERGLSLHQLYKIACRYEVKVDMFLNDTDTNEGKKSNKLDVEFEKLKMNSKGLNHHELETLNMMATRMQEQRRMIEKRPYLIKSFDEANIEE
jgi:transcriptional regulator with XRE-family HTH domain